jgi:hypothetical protein
MPGREPQRWRRLGLVFSPSGQRPWLQSHAQNPVAVPLGGSRYRAYFASRDDQGRANVSSVDFDLEDPAGSAEFGERPVLEPGPIGNFDQHGVYPSSIVQDGDRLLLYFIGFISGKTPPLFYAAVGLAVSEDGGETFERVSPAPIMSTSEHDPCLVSAPMVLREGELWRMWYLSCTSWEEKEDGSLTSTYHIKYAESDDGVDWRREGRVCLDHTHPGERNIARACVVPDGDGYRAWYSFAGDFEYRLGYAESPDGLDWTRRDDELQLTGEPGSWEDQAQAYPWVFEHEGSRYMLYCGNSIGREGFGIAIEQPGVE